MNRKHIRHTYIEREKSLFSIVIEKIEEIEEIEEIEKLMDYTVQDYYLRNSSNR
jgi:hypothetical protein